MCVFVCTGKAGDYAEYYEVILKSDVMFGWYQPDDSLVCALYVCMWQSPLDASLGSLRYYLALFIH
jgi:hypothetical protein